MLERIDIRDLQRVCDERAGSGTTTGPHVNTDGSRVFDEVADDEEVAGVALLFDDVELVIGTLDIFGRYAVRKTPFEPLMDFAGQPRVLRLALGHGELRHAVFFFPHLVVRGDPLGDREGVVAGSWDFGIPLRADLLGGLEEVAVAAEAETVLVRQRLARLDAQHGLVRMGLIAGDVVAVVRDQRWHSQIIAKLDQILADPLFEIEPVVHELEVEVLLAEDRLPFLGRLVCLVDVAEAQACLDLARRAARGRDDALGVPSEDLLVHAGPLAQLPLVRGE